MKNLILLFLSLITTFAQAQIDTMQDRPGIRWAEIESPNFKVVYPEELEGKAQYVLNLLEFYAPKVAAPYDFKTDKYTVIIRFEQATPNGFVTLAPRRSEWFSASSISPLINTLEWYQALAVHEYRHMVQFDFIKDSNVKYAWYLFGEMGQAVLTGVTVPNWYMEGDAVYSETQLTNGGRGRSPRFAARMKSLVVNSEVPSYDQFRGGVYTTSIPNHYVYGYFLITHAYNKYGPKVWKDVIKLASASPLNPYTFYNAFEQVTGQDFASFYYETFDTLKKGWGQKVQMRNQLYTTYYYPITDEGNLYAVKTDLDSFYQLTKNGQVLKDLNITHPGLSKVDVKRGLFAFTRQMPSPRYSYRDYNDVFVLNTKTDTEVRITKGKRVYSPQINPVKDEIMAINFENASKYGLVFYSFNGEESRSIYLQDFDISEAAYINEREAVVTLLDKQGMKFIAKLNLEEQSYKILKAAGRNSAFAMRVQDDKVYFSGDDQGVINIFELDLKTAALAICSNEEIAAYNPYPQNGEIFYVSETANGRIISKTSKACRSVASDYLGDLDQYLGKGPSDNFHKLAPVTEQNYQKLYASKWTSADYNELERGFTPHSWSFIGGQGYQLQAMATNYLNSFTIYGAIGENAIESRPFAQLGVVYSKYYPILSLNLDYRERKDNGFEWTEAGAAVGMTLPYMFRKGLYRGAHALSLSAQHLEVSEREDAYSYQASDDQLFIPGVSFKTSMLKNIRFRELQPSWGYLFGAQYLNADSAQDENFDSYLGYGSLDLYAPGFWTNHGFKLGLSGEYRDQNPASYRIQSPADIVGTFAFSRGYQYEYVDEWSKASLNYILPLGYGNYTFGRWYYISRAYTNLFFDHTKIRDEEDFTLNSAGFELFLESLLLRKLPITLGFRHVEKLSDKKTYDDFFLAVNVAY